MAKTTDVILEDELQSSYIDYAMSVIIGRAIPEARDGLKPAQRRILYAMYKMNNLHNQPTKKSARIVGECFAKDTLVLTDKGLIPIQNIEKGSNVYAQDKLHKVSELYIMPKRRLLRLNLDNGLENIATASQKFRLITKDWRLVWKEAKNIKKGDHILTKSTYPEIIDYVAVGDKKLNENLAYLLGQQISDGCVLVDNERGKYHRIGFSSASPGVINTITQCLKSEFDYTSKIEEKQAQQILTNGNIQIKKFYSIRINNLKINSFLIENFDLLGRKALTKRVPKQLFKSPKRVIFAFLSGLIDGDGHIHSERNTIEYSTVSSELANQLIILLHHLGINGKKYKIKNEGTAQILGRTVHVNDSFRLEFNGENAQRLASRLTLSEENKRIRAEAILHLPSKMVSSDIFPFAGKKVFEELSKNHQGCGWYLNKRGKKFRSGIKYPTGVKIKYSSELQSTQLHVSQIKNWGILGKLNKINSKLAPFINTIIENNIQFSTVTGVAEAYEDKTYDIQVEDKHEFIANGMVSHNCLGKYHPHGDIAVYETLVRMAQSFSMNHTFVDGQGNWGSQDGDPAAAQRYTEARLTRLAEEMLDGLEQDTVDMVPNFDNTEKEPWILPGKMPNLLVNGASGIAVGVATSIPPHNLIEVCDAVVYRLGKSEATTEEIMKIIKGPDFPTGGIAVMSPSSMNGYAYGRGQLTIKGRAEIDQKNNKIAITEIPYNVNKSQLIQAIAALAREKKITGIRDIRDESDRKGIRIVIELKQGENPDQVLNQLYRHTQMEVTYPIINLAIVGKSLKSLNVLQLIDTFISHREEVILRRSRYELEVAKDRLHITDGLLKAIENIDSIIDLVRKSSEAKDARAKMMSQFGLSEKQADAILEMRLGRLTKLEDESLQKEKTSLEAKIKHHTEIINDKEKIDKIIKEEMEELKKRYGRPRKTEIVYSEGTAELTDEDMINDDKVTIILTSEGYVKRMGTNNYKEQARGGKGVISINLKEGDSVRQIINCNNKDYLFCISNTGRVYWLKAYNIPESNRYSEGRAIVNLLNIEGERIVGLLDVMKLANSKLVFLTKKGVIKRMKGELFSHPRSSGVRALTLSAGDEIADATVYSNEKYLIIVSKNGKAIRFGEDELRFTGRASMGVRGIRAINDEAKNILAANEGGSILAITENGYGKITPISEYRLQARGGKGVRNIKITQKTGPVSRSMFVGKEKHLVLINTRGKSIAIPIASIRITGRSASGVRLMRMDEGTKISDAMLFEEDIPSTEQQAPANPQPQQT